MNKIVKIGIVGGGFGASFYFHLHPWCKVEAVSAQLKTEREHLMSVYHCNKSFNTLAALLNDPQIDAVALFTPAPYHAEHCIAALKAGKHVLCAVPAAMTTEECVRLKKAVLQSGRIYMMAETSIYRQDTISVKKFYNQGLFGKMIAASATYHHPGLEHYFFTDAGEKTWRRGLPPMKYATHCTAFLIGVTKQPLVSVSCLGWGDGDPLLANNPYSNPFWNETALFRSGAGTVFNVNISWRGALLPTERCEWHGEKMSFYSESPNGMKPYIVQHTHDLAKDDGGFITAAPTAAVYEQPLWWQTNILPDPLRIESGHGGSHTFLTHEFIEAIINSREPEIGIEAAIAYTLLGIIAHESSLQNGETLSIPTYESL